MSVVELGQDYLNKTIRFSRRLARGPIQKTVDKIYADHLSLVYIFVLSMITNIDAFADLSFLIYNQAEGFRRKMIEYGFIDPQKAYVEKLRRTNKK